MNMEILKVVILHKPEEKFRVAQVQKALEMAARMSNMKIDVKKTSDFVAFSNHSFSPTQTPIIFINGKMEYANAVPAPHILKKKLKEIRERSNSIWI